MVKLTKIYTRTGDDGTTGLADARGAPSMICGLRVTEQLTKPMPRWALRAPRLGKNPSFPK